MSTDQDTKSSGQGSAEKATEIGREPDLLEIERTPKHIANDDADEALKLVAAQYVFRSLCRPVLHAPETLLWALLSVAITDCCLAIVRENRLK